MLSLTHKHGATPSTWLGPRAHQHARGERTIRDAQRGSALASKLLLNLYVRVQQGPELQHHPHPNPTAPTRSVQVASAACSEHGPCGCWQLPGGTSSRWEPHLARTGSEMLGSSLQSRMGATSSARPSAGALLPRCSSLPLNPVSHAAAGCVQK